MRPPPSARSVTRALSRAALVALAGLSLASCIESTDPILIDSQPLFGKELRISYYTLRDGRAHDPGRAAFKWNGGLYARAGGGMPEIDGFSIYSFEQGDHIIQAIPARHTGITQYALLHKLAEGVYQITPIDAADADEQTRDTDCQRGVNASCRIVNRAQLIDFARATAARRKDDGGLVVRLPDGATSRHHAARL